MPIYSMNYLVSNYISALREVVAVAVCVCCGYKVMDQWLTLGLFLALFQFITTADDNFNCEGTFRMFVFLQIVPE